MNDLAQFVLNQVNTKAYELRPRIKAGQVWVCCPFHIEKTPSLRINLDPEKSKVGSIYCFGCEEGQGTWNKLAKKVGLQTLSDDDYATVSAYRRVTKRKENLRKSIEEGVYHRNLQKFDLSFLVKGKLWRGIKLSLLNTLECFSFVNTNTTQPEAFIFIPVKVYGKTVGSISARLEKREGTTSYINSEGEWSRTKGLFPFDLVNSMLQERNLKTVVLVEGPRDALRLIQCGIPALCVFGVRSWSKSKRDLLLSLDIKRVVVYGDSDKAGRHFNSDMKRSLYRYVDVKVSSLYNLCRKIGVEDLDPASVPREYLQIIERFLI